MSRSFPTISIDGLEKMWAQDHSSIVDLLQRVLGAFALRNAALLTDVYSSDADYVNVFGSVKKGGPQILAYLHRLFGGQGLDDHHLVAGPDCSLRRFNDDHALVSVRIRIGRHDPQNGDNAVVRDNRSLHAISRQPHGAWRVVSQMFMDVRPDPHAADHAPS